MRYTIIIIVLLFIQCAGAQNTGSQKIPSRAQKLFDKSKKQLQERDIDGAILSLEQAINIHPTYQGALFSLADLNYSLQNYSEVEKYGEAYIAAGGDNDYTLYSIAISEHKQAKYQEAKDHLIQFLERNPKPNFVRKANQLIASCDLHFQCSDLVYNVEPEAMPEPINSSFPEYYPAISADGKSMVFTRDLPVGDNSLRTQEDLFLSVKKDGSWSQPIFLEEINSDGNDGGHCFSADGKILIFTRCETAETIGGCDLFFTQLKSDGWTKPRNMGTGINSRYWDALPTLSADKRILIFSSDRPMKRGEKRQKKLLVCERSLDGSWSRPRLLHPSLETPGDEMSPFLHPDMQTLYFSSNGFNSLGEGDLFVTRLDSAGLDSWTTPENLCSPINTNKHEVGLFVDMDGKTAYFDRNLTTLDEFLNPDIFSIELHESHRAIACTYIEASIKDAQTGSLIRAKVSISPVDPTKPGHKLLMAPGQFLLPIPLNDDFAFHVEADGYLFYSEHFSFKETSTMIDPLQIEITLQPIQKADEEIPLEAEPVILKNIFFESGEATLLPSSIVELNKLLELLNSNPETRIQINGHTDNVGSVEDNQSLSEARANAVMNWLIEKGINAGRLKSSGFGESRPIADNDTEAGRASNRRTEFVQW